MPVRAHAQATLVPMTPAPMIAIGLFGENAAKLVTGVPAALGVDSDAKIPNAWYVTQLGRGSTHAECSSLQSRSTAIARRNERYIPGGTASSARYLPQGIVFSRAQGASLWDADGRSYIDLNCAFGAILLGYRNQRHLARVAELAEGLDLIGLGTTELE